MNKDYKMTLGDLVELLEDRKDVTIHQYDQTFERPRTIKNISMIKPDVILISVATLDEEGLLSDLTVEDFLNNLQHHRDKYNTPDDTRVVVFDPEAPTTYKGLSLDLSISDRVDINCMGEIMAKNKKKSVGLDRLPKQYSISEVLDWTKTHGVKSDKKKRMVFDGDEMKPYSLRYETFNHSGTDCVVCGLKGSYFYKERQAFNGKVPNTDGRYHFNLYGINDKGDEVLMTKDHIIARGLGGKDIVDNMQSMCTDCNLEKGAMTVEEWDEYLKNKLK